MPDPRQLKVGDRVKFVSLPEEWRYPGNHIHRDSLAFMRKMIRRKSSSRVAMIDAWGYPWVRAVMFQRGKWHHHSWLISESTGWRLVRRRTVPLQ
jgi:hypothetical protein